MPKFRLLPAKAVTSPAEVVPRFKSVPAVNDAAPVVFTVPRVRAFASTIATGPGALAVPKPATDTAPVKSLALSVNVKAPPTLNPDVPVTAIGADWVTFWPALTVSAPALVDPKLRSVAALSVSAPVVATEPSVRAFASLITTGPAEAPVPA